MVVARRITMRMVIKMIHRGHMYNSWINMSDKEIMRHKVATESNRCTGIIITGFCAGYTKSCPCNVFLELRLELFVP